MSTIVSLFLYFGLLFNLNFYENNHKEIVIEDFLKGRWVIDNSPLKSISFLEHQLVQVVSNENGRDIATHMHYRVDHVNINKKTITVSFIQKDLVKDDFLVRNKAIFTIQNNDLMLIETKNSGKLTLQRKVNKHSFY